MMVPSGAPALKVIWFSPSSSVASETEEAINALEHECVALRAALTEHPLVANPTRDDSH